MRVTRRRKLGLLSLGALLVTLAGQLTGCCVVAGTAIATPDGQKMVEALVVGDEVLGIGPGGQIEVGRVAAVRRSVAVTCRQIVLANGDELRVTGSHPVATPSGWTLAADLRKGDRVRLQDGWAGVASIRREMGPFEVFDLSVEGTSNFFAGGLLVHNKSRARPHPPEMLPGKYVGVTPDLYPWCWMELEKDGTGVLGWSPDNWGPAIVKDITQWDAGKTLSANSYELRLTLRNVQGIVKGVVDLEGVDSITLNGETFRLVREEDMRQELERITSAVEAHKGKRAENP